jgi:hypothetical protein
MVPFGLRSSESQAMKEQSVDIALDVQSRTVFYQSSRRDLYILCGWRNQHQRLGRRAAYQDAERSKGKRVGISDFNSIDTGRFRFSAAGLDLEKTWSGSEACSIPSICRR